MSVKFADKSFKLVSSALSGVGKGKLCKIVNYHGLQL
jgi:hypothetical protein